MSSWGFLILTPVYTAEISPPDIRGFYTGLNGVHIGKHPVLFPGSSYS